MSDCSPLPPDITSLETSNDPSHTQSYTELALPTASTFVSTEDSHDARLVAMSALSLLEEDARPSCRDGYQRKHGNQGPNTSLWKTHKKHFFILSASGKPIYTRYGDETKLASFMGVIQAIISYYADEDDSIRSVCAGGHLFVFHVRGPLYLVAVSSTGESEYQLRKQLDMLFDQITLTLTALQLDRIFKQRVNYDLRNLIWGTEIFMDTLCKSFQRDSSIFLESMQCTRIPSRLRDRLTQALIDAAPPKDLLFGLLFAKDRLVTLLRPRNYTLHPKDIYLLVNMIMSSSTFRTVQSWTPVCLPHFNNRGFLHTYVCFITSDLCLALMSTDNSAFFSQSEYKQRIVHAFNSNGIIPALDAAIHVRDFSVFELGISELRHFIIKSRTMGQFVEPQPIAPYTRSQDRKRLQRLYQYALELGSLRPTISNVSCFSTHHETVVYQATSTMEIYAAFGPIVKKDIVVSALVELKKWAKRNDETLFMKSSPLLF
ncbi:hypothetical protein BATDEDRAFT_87530 [Batrachochytrium dendrobatidis JAM81]|uniref:Vacuolar fusion protein MON1 n=2 Tax=Batrachochytrium dendrobatidis TaxID=109871 RepID=F4P0F3_BATDJ|nr:uncharacterized protein BATDEDRAFT_87530 [Batrachochytrium dendrobatidis JAM81]EGF81276.1 hypothetical protein BATDEDRAFT_87530 [Batrachochytrium dendrobatidis JAM81]KAK5669635.1 Vacuolar fusion protein mon1 [Batrachochytrium dendrobatidis]OAJ38159.1 hypothetical protein BDEG_22112 [Batrachochytrium dendrobatidis JEL423]|eukprot:XP_006678148.1 hypothetical protein BATDEDRAFT_87530 [Batrachochytrium dendrobatidis JAM81]